MGNNKNIIFPHYEEASMSTLLIKKRPKKNKKRVICQLTLNN